MISDKSDKRLFLISLLPLFDQFSKFLALHFGLWPSLNQGIVFGLFPLPFWLVINLAIIVFLAAIFFRKPNIPIFLILAGGFSNFLDRIFWGGVVDLISLPHFPWKFNLADLGITVGVILLLHCFMVSWFCGKKASRQCDNDTMEQ